MQSRATSPASKKSTVGAGKVPAHTGATTEKSVARRAAGKTARAKAQREAERATEARRIETLKRACMVAGDDHNPAAESLYRESAQLIYAIVRASLRAAFPGTQKRRQLAASMKPAVQAVARVIRTWKAGAK